VWTFTTKRKTIYNKAARRRQLNLKSYWTIQCNRMLTYNIPKKRLVMLTYIFSAMLRLNFWPIPLKTAEIMLIIKPGKDPKELSSYRPISLLSIINKLFEKLVLRRLNRDPPHHFGFRNRHYSATNTLNYPYHQSSIRRQTLLYVNTLRCEASLW
jgi:hypothetical protein